LVVTLVKVACVSKSIATTIVTYSPSSMVMMMVVVHVRGIG
jgi:hypothetical protein